MGALDKEFILIDKDHAELFATHNANLIRITVIFEERAEIDLTKKQARELIARLEKLVKE